MDTGCPAHPGASPTAAAAMETLSAPREAVAVLRGLSLRAWHGMPRPRHPPLLAPCQKPGLFWAANGAGSQQHLQRSAFALPKGSSSGRREMQTSPGSAVPGAPGLQSPSLAARGAGNHPQPWMECRADGRTNSTGISVSHNLLPYSLPRLTFSSHGADLLLEKATGTLEGFWSGRWCSALNTTKDNTQDPRGFTFFFFLFKDPG